MNKVKFNKIVRNYSRISADDRVQLEELAAGFPYSQVIHTLVAKTHHDAHTSMAESTLHYAAMYATDRNQLRQIIQQDISPSKGKGAKDQPSTGKSSDMKSNLETLKANREAYEKLLGEEPKNTLAKAKPVKKTVTTRKSSTIPAKKKTSPIAKTKKTPAKATNTKKKSTVTKTSPADKAPAAVKKTATIKKKSATKKTSPSKKTDAKSTNSKAKSETSVADKKKAAVTKRKTSTTAAGKKSTKSATKKTVSKTKTSSQPKKKRAVKKKINKPKK